MPPAGLKRGGARNRADRTSWQLDERQCRRVIGRSHDAWAAGYPLSRFITLAWGRAGIDASEAVQATGEFIYKAREWMRWHGYPMPWVWVQETGDVFGQHAHILLSVPSELDLLFRPMPRRWAKSFTGGEYQTGHVDSQKLGAAYAADANPALYEAVLKGKLHYMLKCAPATIERPLGLEGWGHKEWGQSCRVIGKRVGAWQRGQGGILISGPIDRATGASRPLNR